MFLAESYSLAVMLCVVTMLCWGSWANRQKLAGKDWRFQLFYWNYATGVLVLALVLALTLGSTGTQGRAFLPDIRQASAGALGSALPGDTFNGALAVALGEHADMADAVAFANLAASISVTRLGAQASIPTRAEVDALRR
jgi:glucose uptake protein